MNLSTIDWCIVGGLLCGLAAIALYARRYARSVSDFLAGNRCAGRYLLTLSEGLAAMGLVGTVANFEKFYKAGFAASWWGMMLLPLGLVIALSGWVNYRYRETRAMTMAQFFEMRYSRRFRVFAGIVGWASGVLNFGIFPAITARFVIYFCGFPAEIPVGGLPIPTMVPVIAAMMTITLILTLSGGMVTVMITDFFQAQFVNIAFMIVMVVLLLKFSWGDVAETLTSAPAGKSLVNPFDQGEMDSFNFWFFLILAFKLVYNRLGWQGTQGYACAAKSPHEAKMANVLAEWRGGVSYLILMLMPICAYVLLHDPKFASEAGLIQQTLATIPEKQIQQQMTTPIALVHMLPPGVAGLLCAAMIAATIGNDSTYMHAWGSMFIQDVLLPFRKKPFTPKQHLRLLRLSIVGVAVFSFFFSLLFPIRDYVVMYQLITGAIYLGGSGAVIIGGLYWKKGTTAGAWAGMITGGALAAGGAAMRAIWPHVDALAVLNPEFPVNGAWMALIASISAIVVYGVVSLLTCRQVCDMDRLLHRGRYAVAGEHQAVARRVRFRWLGITEECTRGDRIIYGLKISWTLFWCATFVAGTTVGLVWGIPDAWWLRYWAFTIVLGLTVGSITVVWFLWGGFKDLAALTRSLASTKRDVADDGSVREVRSAEVGGRRDAVRV